MNDQFYKYFFECFVAYAFKRGVPRPQAMAARDLLREHMQKADATEPPEPVFDRVIEQIWLNPPPIPPHRQPRQIVRVVPLPPLPPWEPANTPPPLPPKPEPKFAPVKFKSKIKTERWEDYVVYTYDPHTGLPLDEQMRAGFEDRLSAIDWDYYFHED